jgi:hypothetical protein
VSFKTAVNGTPNMQNAWTQGLGALRALDRPHIVPEDPRRLLGSADVDAALRVHEPNAHRWDFAIGYRHSNKPKEYVYWVEIHTANDKETKVVLAKLRWLKTWLVGPGNLLNQFERDFIWLSSGATTFTLGAPQLKQFSQLGLQHKGRVLRISTKRQI